MRRERGGARPVTGARTGADPTLRPVTDTPLAGLRVLELGAFIAGPFAGQLLGDLGADVIKIEPPETGDIMRRYGVRVEGKSLWWPAIARNKRSVAINLRDARGQALAPALPPRGASG